MAETDLVFEDPREHQRRFYEHLRAAWHQIVIENKNSNRDHLDYVILTSLYRGLTLEDTISRLLEHFHPRTEKRVGTPAIWYENAKTSWGENMFGATLLPVLRELQDEVQTIALGRTTVIDPNWRETASLFRRFYFAWGNEVWIQQNPHVVLERVAALVAHFEETGCFKRAA